MSGAADAQRVERKLGAVADALTGVSRKRALTAGGMAGKKAALEVAREVTGGSGRLSHLGKRGVKLGAGFDFQGSQRIVINLRPGGAWRLMDRGARPHEQPKRRGKGPMVIGAGVFSHVDHPGTHGRGAIDKAGDEIVHKVPPETMKAIHQEVLRSWRR